MAPHSAETKAKISQALKGRKLSEEQKRKISCALKGNPGGMKGHNYGSVCQKCGKVHVNPMKGRKHSKETRQKISRILTGRRLSEEQKKKISQTMKGRPLSPEHRAKVIKANKSPEKRKKISKFFKGSNFRRKMVASRNFEQVRAFYNLPEDAVFYPATLYEHKFARKILIEGGKSRGYFTHHSYKHMREQPLYLANNVSGCLNIHAVTGELL